MAQLRASRKKKPVVVSSDSDEDDRSPPPKRTKRGTTTTLSTTGVAGSRKDVKPPPPSSSSTSKKAVAKSPAKPKPASRPITSFFGVAPPRQHSAQPTPSPEKSTASTAEVDDILDSDDDGPPVPPAKRQTALPVRKGIAPVVTHRDAPLKTNQKFIRNQASASVQPAPATTSTADRRPWNEKYGPTSLNEVAVHKKKVDTVREWLAGVLNGRERKRLLLLKGPAGSGKTTALSLISKEMGVHIHEWKNPTSSLSSSDGFVSATAQFEEFVGRTGAFGTLSFEEPEQPRPQAKPPVHPGRQKQLILVEEFPNTFTRGSSIIQSFRSSVLNYLAAATPSATSFFSGKASLDQPVTPIVMVISETLLSTNTASADSFTAHRLLGPEILTHPGVTVVEFNPIAPTFMTKALELIIHKEARRSGRKKTVGPQVIQYLTELGDIRSAVSSLEFLCLRGDDQEWGATIDALKGKKQKDVPMTKMERDSLEMVTQRESTLGIFHAVGRVVYNKRLPNDPTKPVSQPPTYFPERRRPKAPEADVDALIDEIGTDTDTFVAALHENYVLSTDAGDSEETLDCINGCVDALSDADLLSPDRFGRSGRQFQGSGADNLRQDEMSFQTSVRGLLYNLPNPVKRIAPPPGVMGAKANAKGVNGGGNVAPSKGSAFAMYYPASLRLWRQQEETSDLLELWISRAQKGQLLAPTDAFAGTSSTPAVVGGVDTWRKTSTPFAKPLSNPTSSSLSSENTASAQPPDETSGPILLGSGTSARAEMLLERLPYLTRILSQHLKPKRLPSARSFASASAASSAATTTIRELQKVTSFSGSATPRYSGTNADEDAADGGVDDDKATPEDEQWATDRPGYASPKKRRRGVWVARKGGGDDGEGESAVPMVLSAVEGKGASGVLSDDDIED